MPVIRSRLNTRSAEFRANAERMRGLVADLREKVAQAAAGGPEEARAKHAARGKLLPRERVRTLLDPGSPFLELWRRSPPTACTTATCRPPASSPASAASRAASA